MSNTDGDSPAGPRGGDPRWWRPKVPNDAQRARYTAQLTLMIDGLSEALTALRGPSAVVTAYPDPNNLAATQFLYRVDTILVRTVDADKVLTGLSLSPDDMAPGPRLPEQPSWLSVVALPTDRRWTDAGEALTPAQSALAFLEASVGVGVAGFDRVVHLTSNSGCPASEPVPAKRGPDPSVDADPTLGTGVTVAVIDSGWPNENGVPFRVPPSHWLTGVHGEPELAGMVGGPREALLAHYRGHGLFVAGVIKCMAPAAGVEVYSWGPTTYGQIESELAPILDRVLRTGPDIISMSAGTGISPVASASAETDDNPQRATGTAQQPPMSLEAFADELRPTTTLLVCAAGNDGNQGPFEPASSPWTRPAEPPIKVAVGGLKKDGRLAKWSNRGTWVDVYARGAKLVNAYPNGVYTYLETDPIGSVATFSHRLARWSGTSFATPLVAGLIAARLSWRDEETWTARDAWVALRAKAYANAPFGLPTLEPGDADRP